MRGQIITAGRIIGTQMACRDPAGSFESAGYAVLHQPLHWRWVAGRTLTLTNSDGSIALERLP